MSTANVILELDLLLQARAATAFEESILEMRRNGGGVIVFSEDAGPDSLRMSTGEPFAFRALANETR